jgi:allantoate deiminase
MRLVAQIRRWMREAGMLTWQDAVGNVHGRVDGALCATCMVAPLVIEAEMSLFTRSSLAAGPGADAPVLLIGSHYDTVYDAGQYDGALGIIVGALPSCAMLLMNCSH